MPVEIQSESKVELMNFMGGDDSVAMSAWVSFDGDDVSRLEDRDKVQGLINFLWRNGHTSPFEHTVFTFGIETPIFVAREFMRHRAASYNEMSGRYTVLPQKFYVPDRSRPKQQVGKAGNYEFIEGTYVQNRMVEGGFERIYNEVYKEYERMLAAGVAKEVARDILPVGTFTRFYVTMNARNLMHFLTLRTDSTALYEIRQVAAAMEEHLKQKMPLTYDAYRAKQGRKESPVVPEPTSGAAGLLTKDAKAVTINVTPTAVPFSQAVEKAVKDAIERLERKGSSDRRVAERKPTNPSERQREITRENTKANLEEPLTGIFFPRDTGEAYQEFTPVSPEQKMYKAYREDLNVLRDRVRAGLKNRLGTE